MNNTLIKIEPNSTIQDNLFSIIKCNIDNTFKVLTIITPTGEIIVNVTYNKLEAYFLKYPELRNIRYIISEVENSSTKRIIKIIPNPGSA